MKIIVNTLIFFGIMLGTAAIFNLFCRTVQFIFNQSFKLEEKSSVIITGIGCIIGLVCAIMHFVEEQAEE